MTRRKDYGCKVTAPGLDHIHICDQPARHVLGPEHHCTTCENWWIPDGDGVQLANYEGD